MIEQIKSEVILTVENMEENKIDKENKNENTAVEDNKIVIDFDKLLEINSDTVAWIRINNTNSYTMFSELKNIYDNKLGKDVNITIYLENDVIEYKVFSIYLEEPTNISSISRYIQEDVLDQIKNTSKIDFDIDVDINDKFLTLSTCYNESDKRILMHAVRL